MGHSHHWRVVCAPHVVGVEARLGTRDKWQELRQRRSVKAEDTRVPHKDGKADS